jgi:Ca2+-binding RTX toxin-like protein
LTVDTAVNDITFNGGSGIDTIVIDNLDLTANTVSLTAVEQIQIQQAVTLDSSMLSGKTFLMDTDGAGNDTLTVTMDSVSVDLSTLAFTSDYAAADTITIDGTGIALAETIVGSSHVDIINGGASGDTITAGAGADTVTGGAGSDYIDLTETVAAIDNVVIDADNAGVDTIVGFAEGAGTDTITLDADDTTDATAAAAAVVAGVATALSTATNTWDISAVAAAVDTADIYEVTTTLDDDVTLSATSTGAQLFEALSSDAGAIASITVGANATSAYLITYQNSNAYVWHMAGDAGDATIESDDVSLEVVITGVASGGITAGDFLMD